MWLIWTLKTSSLPRATVKHLKESVFDYLTPTLWRHQEAGNESCWSDFVSTDNKTEVQSSSNLACSLMYCLYKKATTSDINTFPPANGNAKNTYRTMPSNYVKSHQCHLCRKLYVAFTSVYSHRLAEGCVCFSTITCVEYFVSCCFYQAVSSHQRTDLWDKSCCQDNKVCIKSCNIVKKGHNAFVCLHMKGV